MSATREAGVFEVAGLAAALPLVGGVEGEGDEALAGQLGGVEAGGLFLDAASGVDGHDRRVRPVPGEVVDGSLCALDPVSVRATKRGHRPDRIRPTAASQDRKSTWSRTGADCRCRWASPVPTRTTVSG